MIFRSYLNIFSGISYLNDVQKNPLEFSFRCLVYFNFTFLSALFRFVLKVSLNIFAKITKHYITKYYLLNIIHKAIYFYSSLKNTCVFDTSPLSAFNMREYFNVFIELIVKVTGMVF